MNRTDHKKMAEWYLADAQVSTDMAADTIIKYGSAEDREQWKTDLITQIIAGAQLSATMAAAHASLANYVELAAVDFNGNLGDK